MTTSITILADETFTGIGDHSFSARNSAYFQAGERMKGEKSEARGALPSRGRGTRPTEPRSGEIFIAQGESANPGYGFKNEFSAEGASERSGEQTEDSRPTPIGYEYMTAGSVAPPALNPFLKRVPRARRLAQGYKYAAATRLDFLTLRRARCLLRAASHP